MTTYLDALARIHARVATPPFTGICRSVLDENEWDDEIHCCELYAGHDCNDDGPEEHQDGQLVWVYNRDGADVERVS